MNEKAGDALTDVLSLMTPVELNVVPLNVWL